MIILEGNLSELRYYAIVKEMGELIGKREIKIKFMISVLVQF